MKTKTRSEIIVVDTTQPIVHVPQEKKEFSVLPTLRLFTVLMCTLFLLAFSGVEVGHVLSYLVPLCVAVYFANEIFKRWGWWYSVWCVSLGVVLFSVGFGETYMNHMQSLFASIQKISLGGLFVSAILFILTLKGK